MAKTIYPTSLTYSRNLKNPLEDDVLYAKLDDAKAYVDDPYKNAYAGLVIAVTGDTEEKNGLYFVKQAAGEGGATEGILVKIGEGGGSGYTEGISAITINGKAALVTSGQAIIDIFGNEIKIGDVILNSTGGTAYGSGSTIHAVLQAINLALEAATSGSGITTITSTGGTIEVTSVSSAQKNVEVKVSAVSGNTLEIKTDGMFVEGLYYEGDDSEE